MQTTRELQGDFARTSADGMHRAVRMAFAENGHAASYLLRRLARVEAERIAQQEPVLLARSEHVVVIDHAKAGSVTVHERYAAVSWGGKHVSSPYPATLSAITIPGARAGGSHGKLHVVPA